MNKTVIVPVLKLEDADVLYVKQKKQSIVKRMVSGWMRG